MDNISAFVNSYFSTYSSVIFLKLMLFCFFLYLFCLSQHREEVSGDIFDMLLTFTDFMAFKEMFLDYRAVSVI